MSKELYEMKSQDWGEFLKWWWSTLERGDNVSLDEIVSILPNSAFKEPNTEPSEAVLEAMINLNSLYRMIDMDVVEDDGPIMNTTNPEDT